LDCHRSSQAINACGNPCSAESNFGVMQSLRSHKRSLEKSGASGAAKMTGIRGWIGGEPVSGVCCGATRPLGQPSGRHTLTRDWVFTTSCSALSELQPTGSKPRELETYRRALACPSFSSNSGASVSKA